ncbi:MAG TPA: hypothetical protein VN670_05020 [Acidobacteriaceae bacterium]|nr:hypothetical protein [Acidobacteriaceae bacterium]
MKNLLRFQALGASLVFFVAAAGAAAQVPGWKTHSYPADGFSVSLPADPQIQSQDMQLPAGGKAETRLYQLGVGDAGLMIGMFHAGAMVPGKTPDQVLQDGKNGALAKTQAHLISEKKITLGDAAGLEMVAENPTLHIKARLFVAGTRVYTIMEVYPIGKPFAHAEEFLDSFRIVPVEAK